MPRTREELLKRKRELRRAAWLANPEAEREKERRYRGVARDYEGFTEDNRIACQQHYQANREWRALSIRLRKYGLTVDQYHALLERQDFQCAICGVEEVGRKNSNALLYVDHDHATGAVRGLLCHGCNDALGKFGDDIGLLEKAIVYLLASRARMAA